MFQTRQELVAYSVLRNARMLNYPFYDAFVQCLPNVDRFYLFVESECDDDTPELAVRLAERFSKFCVEYIHLVWDSEEAIAQAQNLGSAFLRERGHDFALLNQADEFFSPRIRPLLRIAQLLRKEVGFKIVSTWRVRWLELDGIYGRFLSTSQLSTGDGANNVAHIDWRIPIHVMHLGSVFSPEVKYAHHGHLYGGYEPHEIIAAHAEDMEIVEQQFERMTGRPRFRENPYRLRENEAAVAAYMDAGLTEYPFEMALERLTRSEFNG